MKLNGLFIAVLFLPSAVWSASPPAEAKQEIFSDFSEGLNTQWPSHKIPNNQSPNLTNVLLDENPSQLVKRKGYQILGSTNTLTKIDIIFPFNMSNGDLEFIVSDSSIVLATKDFNVYKNITSGLNSNLQLDCAQVRNKVWCTNGSDAIFTYDGSTVVVLDGGTYGGTVYPNVPRGRFIEFDQERVWLFNTNVNNSALDFSALSSTDGIAIAPDDSRAWPATNELNVGQGDGQFGTALWTDSGMLFCSKQASIYSRFGTDETNYYLRKTRADVGALSDKSVTFNSNLVYFAGRGNGQIGIYAFDGNDAVRISDNFADDIAKMNANVSNVVSNVWDTQSDFLRGSFSGSTATENGILRMYLDKINWTMNAADADANFPATTLNSGSTSTGFQFFSPTITVPSNFKGYVFSETMNIKSALFSPTLNITIKHNGNGRFDIGSIDVTNGLNTAYFYDYSTFSFTGDEINNSSINIKVELVCKINPSCQVQFNNPWVRSGDIHGGNMVLSPSSTGSFVSDITTITSITSWGNFNATRQTNEGKIDFYYKTATSAVNITTYPWIPISAGNLIRSTATDTYIQWTSTIANISTITPTTIDLVSINRVVGGVSGRQSFGISAKGRFWLAISTDDVGKEVLIYVKSRNSNAFTKFEGIPARSFLSNNGLFYAGHSTYGAIMRLESGTNDNGLAINAFYETPDLFFGDPYREKKIDQYFIDLEKEQGKTFLLGISKNGGDFDEVAIDASGSGRLLKTLRAQSRFGKYFRFRFRNNQLDKNLMLNTFGIQYLPSTIDE